MTEFHLISHHLCPYVQRAAIVLAEKNITHKRTNIDLSDKPDWFVKASPLGRVPILQVDDAVLFESQVIAEYLDEITPGSLHPENPLEKARHRSWIEFASETLNAIAGFYSAPDEKIFEEKRRNLAAKFARIEEEVSGPLFEGKKFHLIDGVWATVFRYVDTFDQIADFQLLENLPAVAVWRKNVSTRPSVISAPPQGYPERLMQFLSKKNSHLSTLIG
ncbi:Glutathione S-transferase [hydrothermal vent metagenome]|uniref:Glutathione S-transferase n=1 Tax=hydrothermal vent metagenome TaxID=652676 RepID=A0A3B0S3S4_9ZZZZ